MIYSWAEDENGFLVWNSKGFESKPRFVIIGEQVIKLHPNKLNAEWRTKMEMVLKIWSPPGFEFCTNGYKNRFVNGFDLHGNPAFSYDDLLVDCRFDTKYTPSIMKIYDTAMVINNKLGMTFGDISPSNIICDPASDEVFLVDLDDIMPLDDAQLQVFNSNKDKILNHNRWIIS